MKLLAHSIVISVPKILGDWENIGPCSAFGGVATCGDGIQVQSRTCTDGTVDKCLDEDMHRITICRYAGTMCGEY